MTEREELASIAASLRAYLEWQLDCGSSGIPRRPRAAGPGAKHAPSSTGAEAPPVVRAAATGAAPAAAPAPAASAASHEMTSLAAALAAPTAPAPTEITAREPRPAPRELAVVRDEVATCTRCELAGTRKNTVFSRGNPAATLCFVGEAPGADEDEQGVPFVGKAGQLLDRMIVAMGLDPEKDVYVCNIIKCRPPGNRRPEPNEVEACIPYLHEQLAAVDPKVIVAMGNTAVAALLGTKLGISKVRGAWKIYRGKVPVMPTFHPSYLLRTSPTQAEAKRQVWEDLQAVMKELGLAKKPRGA